MRYLLLLVLLLRLLSVTPLVIDDDEAWFSSSAAALHVPDAGPLAFYDRAIDNKPPGTVWFYWLVQAITRSGNDPRVARLAFLVALGLGSWFVSRIARKIAEEQGRDPARSALFAGASVWLGSAAATPKLLALTNEGLLLPFISAAMLLTVPANSARSRSGERWQAFLAGLVLGVAVLIKQTAVLFLFPVFLGLALRDGPQGKPSLRAHEKWPLLALALLGCVLPLLFAVPAVGARDFWYWTWIYPFHVLPQARSTLFSTWQPIFGNSLLFAVALFPLYRPLLRSRFWEPVWRSASLTTVAVSLASSAAAIGLGKGLFPHYFLLQLPALGVLASQGVDRPRRALAWLGTLSLLNAIIVALPVSGIFWGEDLPYFQRLGQRVQQAVPPSERIFVWSGIALPLPPAQRQYATGFVMARYLVPPYSTRETLEKFRREFEASPPALVLDLHERGDNRFNYPLSYHPWLQAKLEKEYRRLLDPTLPWVAFYLRNDHPAPPSLRAPAPHPWLPPADPLQVMLSELASENRRTFSLLADDLGDVDLFLRTYFALRHFCEAENCAADPAARALALRMDVELLAWRSGFKNGDPRIPDGSGLAASMRVIASTLGYDQPFALEQRLAWWPSLAVVEMQPVALPRQR